MPWSGGDKAQPTNLLRRAKFVTGSDGAAGANYKIPRLFAMFVALATASTLPLRR
jgi:hypothetical protein